VGSNPTLSANDRLADEPWPWRRLRALTHARPGALV